MSGILLLACEWDVALNLYRSSNTCGYVSCLLSLHVDSFHGMFCGMLNFDTFVFNQEDKLIE